MIRKLTLLAGIVYFKYCAINKTILLFYYKQLYQTNLIIKGRVSFGRFFQLSINQQAHVTLGCKITFMDNCRVAALNDSKVTIGNGTFFNHGCSITAMTNIKIGEYCLFGENVKLYDHNHKFRDTTTLIKDQGYSIGSVQIGNNVWIGSNVIILKGVTIGDHCVIGAGSIISNNVASFSIVQNKLDNLICKSIKK